MYAEGVYNVYKNSVNDNLSCELFIQEDQIDKNSVNELLKDIKKSKIVIYTAFSGDYDDLKEPEFIDENCDYVCFTDSDDVKSDIWEIHKYVPSRLDNNRIAKEFKVFPNRYFPEYKYSFWIDGSFRIRGSIREYIYKYIKSNMLCVIHPERNCIYDEMECSLLFSRYPKIIMKEQIEFYKSQGMPKHYGLCALGIIFRKHNDPQIVNIMEQWWEEITRFSNQDQLSLSYLLWKNNYKISVSSVYCWDNEYWGIDSDKSYQHKTTINSPLCSNNLMNNLKNNIQDTNILTKEELYILYNDIKLLRHEINDSHLNEIIDKLNNTIKIKDKTITELNNIHKIKDETIDKLNNDIHKVVDDIDMLNSIIHDNNKKISNLKHEINNLQKEIRTQSNEITILNNKISLKNNEIKKLKTKNKKLTKKQKEILSSTSWKITKPLRKIKTKINKPPKGKKRIETSNTQSKKNVKKSTNKKVKKISKNNYSFIKTYPYHYKTYIINNKVKRVNLFFDQIDENIYKFNQLIPFILNYCTKYNYSLRVIYNTADFEKFNLFLKDNKIKLPKYVSFLNLKEDNYIEIGLNEKYICTSWKNAKCLMNTPSINSTIYYYLDDLTAYNDLNFFRNSSICYKNNAVVLNDNLNKSEKLRNFSYEYNVEINKKIDGKNKILYCDFGEFIIEGIELLNYLFLNNNIDINEWKVYVLSKKNISKLYDDPNMLITHVSKKLDEFDLCLKIEYNKKSITNKNDNVIKININPIKDNNYNILDITNKNGIDSFNKFISTKVKSKPFLEIGEIFNNINEVN